MCWWPGICQFVDAVLNFASCPAAPTSTTGGAGLRAALSHRQPARLPPASSHPSPQTVAFCPTASPASQVVLGFVRPSPTGNLRPAWNAVHHNLGRLTILSAWVTIYLGIVIGHAAPTYNLDYVAWLCPTAIVMGLMVIADIVLTTLRSRREAQPEDRAAQELIDVEQSAAAAAAAADGQKFVEVYGSGRVGRGNSGPSSSNSNSNADGVVEVDAVRANVRAD